MGGGKKQKYEVWGMREIRTEEQKLRKAEEKPQTPHHIPLTIFFITLIFDLQATEE